MGIFHHSLGKSNTSLTLTTEASSQYKSIQHSIDAWMDGTARPMVRQMEMAKLRTGELQLRYDQLVAFARLHGLEISAAQQSVPQDVSSRMDTCMQQLHPHAAQQLEVHTKADLHTRLRPGMPSLLTPNASQHPDTDEIVHLLQHLGPWCDAGRSYPEAMGGLRALGGALRRRYTRKGAQLLLQLQYEVHAMWGRRQVYELPQIFIDDFAAVRQHIEYLENSIAKLQVLVCQQEAQGTTLTV